MSKPIRAAESASPQPLRRLPLPPALRYPSFRAFWLGSLASILGFQMLQFSLLWLVHDLTGSALYLGYVGAASAVPAILLNLFGGVLADRLDRRRLIIATQTTLAALILTLATLKLLDIVEVWHVLLFAAITGAVNAIDIPSRMAFYPNLIDRKVMMSAVALNSALWQGTRIPAFAAAGFIIARSGTEGSFFAAGAGFLVMAAVIYSIRVPPAGRTSGGSTGGQILEGIRFIKGNSRFSFLIGMSFFNSFFGMAYVVLMPVFAVDMLGRGAVGAGILLSINGVGGILANLWLGSRGNVRHKGLLLIGGATMTGLCVAAFGLSSHFVGSYYLAIALMLVTGAFSSAYMVSVVSSLQVMVPDRMRGRVMGFYGMTYNIMPLGGLQAGAIASLVGPPLGAPVAIAIGGLAVSAFALGPALVNRRVRDLGAYLERIEETRSPSGATLRGSPVSGGGQ